MNRGRDRRTISFDESFLETLSEVHQRLNCINHAYCLMGNHYPILMETPDANLSRIMRHINGVYTQRTIGSVSFITHQIRKRKREDDSFKSEIDSVILCVVRKAA